MELLILVPASVNRRDVIKTIGANGLATTGIARGFRREELGTVRLIETGIEYDLPRREDYHVVHLDERNQYYARPEADEINVFNVPDVSRRALRENVVVVNGDEMAVAAPPAPVTNLEPSRVLPTGLGSNFRRTRGVITANARRERPLTVRLAGRRVRIESERFTMDHPSGEYRTYELSTTEVDVETKTVTDELVDAPGVPENQRSLKTEYGSVRVVAVPTLHVRDRGEMTVVELEAMG